MIISNHRRDRSRSPIKVDSLGRRRDKIHDVKSNELNMMNQLMMTNMYQPGNMLMAGSMYPNMMMQGAMMGVPSTGIEMLPATDIDMMNTPTVDMTAMAGSQNVNPAASNSIDMGNIGMMGGMIMDPSMIGMYPSMGSEMAVVPEKKEIKLKHCVLTPPEPGIPLPPHRVKPAGCRTIFVGGLPDKIRESTVMEIFEMYGRIHTLRLSKKNFCHIRFDGESSVDAAMSISGFSIKLISSSKDDKEDDDDSKATVGRLHVDYAWSRDDQNEYERRQNEYERRQRQMMRAQQAQMHQLNAHQMANQTNSNQPVRQSPSPIKITPFSNPAIVQIAAKVKSEEHFAAALPTLIAWLERGECSKKNSSQFYSMIQATNTHVRRLFNEKIQAEEELQECKERVKSNIEKVMDQLEQVAKVFGAAVHQRVWDHFTKPQRKNIETWQKMAQEFITLKEEFHEKFYNDDNEYNSSTAGGKHVYDMSNNEIQRLKRENESLQFQLEAYKNEVDVIKSDAQMEMEKFKVQFIARQALQTMKNPTLPQPMDKPPPPPPLPVEIETEDKLDETVEAGSGEAKLIGVISAFLQVHPRGASVEYVLSYVRALFPRVAAAAVRRVLHKHGDVFRRATTGVGADIEHRWHFIAFQTAHPDNVPTTDMSVIDE